MQQYNISTGSVTYAIKGRDLLRKYGYNANIKRKTSGPETNGCGYSITVSGDITKIEELLKNHDVKIIKTESI